LGLDASLCQILQILSVTLFEKTPILQAIQPSNSTDNLFDSANQLNLFAYSRTAVKYVSCRRQSEKRFLLLEAQKVKVIELSPARQKRLCHPTEEAKVP
jgi:hypothetical protein